MAEEVGQAGAKPEGAAAAAAVGGGGAVPALPPGVLEHHKRSAATLQLLGAVALPHRAAVDMVSGGLEKGVWMVVM